VDGRRTHVLADGIHPGMVALAQRLVVLVGGGGLGQLGGQPDLRQRLGDHVIEVLVVLVVDQRAHRGVQRGQHLRAVRLLGGDRHPHRAPGLLHHLLVLLGQVTPLVEHRQAHHVEFDVDIADLLDLQDPA
jgi:hypothetical protein